MVSTQATAEQRIVLHGISWETYERLLADHESSSVPRFTYDRGELEIMSPRPEHEDSIWAIETVIEIVAEEWGIEFWNLRSTTFRREDLERGFEPDTCFYLSNEETMRGKTDIDLSVDPPPDLVIEVDLTHSSLPKRGIFRSLGVREVWRFDGARITMLLLDCDDYAEVTESRELSGLTVDHVLDLVSARKDRGRLQWLRHIREWARENSPPKY